MRAGRSAGVWWLTAARPSAPPFEDGLLPDNPAQRIRLPRADRYQPVVWSAEQASQFLAATAGDPLAGLSRLALVLGLRHGEQLGLRWADVDAGGGTLTVHATRVPVGAQSKGRRKAHVATGCSPWMRPRRGCSASTATGRSNKRRAPGRWPSTCSPTRTAAPFITWTKVKATCDIWNGTETVPTPMRITARLQITTWVGRVRKGRFSQTEDYNGAPQWTFKGRFTRGAVTGKVHKITTYGIDAALGYGCTWGPLTFDLAAN